MWSDLIEYKKNKLLSVFFYKAPPKVLLEFRRIQSNFLWRGCENKRTIHWVKWLDVCKPLNQGGLGIQDVEVLKISLLNKWKWRLLRDHDVMCNKILRSRYMNFEVKVMIRDNGVLNSRDSIWWRKIVIANSSVAVGQNFTYVVRCTTNNGEGTTFWHSMWTSEQSLKEAFPEVYEPVCKDCSVVDADHWHEDNWSWNFSELVNYAENCWWSIIENSGCKIM